jgi:hypothetical protein
MLSAEFVNSACANAVNYPTQSLLVQPDAALMPPPYPDNIRSKGWRFELDVERILQSDTWALTPDHLRPWLLMIAMVSWIQTPCGSLPNCSKLISRRIGMDLDEFDESRGILLRGWCEATNGRLYHNTITTQVLGMLGCQWRERERKAAYRAKHASISSDTRDSDKHKSDSNSSMSRGTVDGTSWQSHGKDDTGTGTGTGTISNYLADQASPDQVPGCPHQEVIALYKRILPMLPVPRAWHEKRQALLRARWRWVLTARQDNGQPFADDRISALRFFEKFFEQVGRSDFLTGRSGKWVDCDLSFLLKEEKFLKVIEGCYQNSEATK